MTRGQIVSIRQLHDGWDLWPIGTVWDGLHNRAEMARFKLMLSMQPVCHMQPLVGAVTWQLKHEHYPETNVQWDWLSLGADPDDDRVVQNGRPAVLNDHADGFEVELQPGITLFVDSMGQHAAVLDVQQAYSGMAVVKWKRRKKIEWRDQSKAI